MVDEEKKGLVFRIEKYMISDGVGIRTNVFLKGCPLKCIWCFNPEGIQAKMEILIFRKKCTLCGECAGTCPRNAIWIEDGRLRVDRESCDACGKCVSACPCGALEICGKLMTANEIIQEVRKDEIFYRRSGGGVTLTGGELSAQPRFAKGLLMACKNEFSTAIETNGFCQWDTLKGLLEYSDQVFFDLKLMDAKKHRKLTGVRNDLILSNLKRASRRHNNIAVRIPLVPGFNDDLHNITETAKFVRSLENISRIEILPYVDFGKAKYEMLDLVYKIPHVKSPSSEHLREIVEVITRYGINCRVVD